MYNLAQSTKSAISSQIDIMDYFLAGEDQQQTNQPNNLNRLAVNPNLQLVHRNPLYTGSYVSGSRKL